MLTWYMLLAEIVHITSASPQLHKCSAKANNCTITHVSWKEQNHYWTQAHKPKQTYFTQWNPKTFSNFSE